MQGNLSEFTMAELLQLFALAERTGTLMVTTETGTSRVLIESGRVIGIGLEDYDVHSDIMACELMPARSGAALESVTPTPMTPGLSFIVRNLVEPERWDLFVRRCVESQVYPFLTTERGEFEIRIERVPFCPVAVTLSVQQLVLDGSRWVSEMEENNLDGFGPDKEFVRAGDSFERMDVNTVEWLVWSILDVPQTIRRAAQRVGVPILDATSAVRKQVEQGVLQRA